MDQIQQQLKEYCDKLIKEKEDLILGAIRKVDEEFKSISELARFGAINYHPDGREIFTYKNKPLLEFYPLETKFSAQNGEYKATLSYQYKELYK